MKTKKQAELAASFLLAVGDKDKEMYSGIIACLERLGYYPQKQQANLSFKHDLHNKQIAKMGIRSGKTPYPFLALRFSACRGYSKRFADIVEANIIKYPHKAARCVEGDCDYCAGEPDTHTYMCAIENGESKSHCGAYALEIPNLSPEDMDEIEKLMNQEHVYLLRHEANRE